MGTLGRRIKKAREAKRLSQAQVGEHFGITAKAVSMWERDKNSPDPDRLPALARFLGVSNDLLLTGRESTKRIMAGPPLVGYVGAGGQFFPLDDHAMGQGMDVAEPPPGGDEDAAVAVKVRGHSMHPVYRDGDTLYYTRNRANDWMALIGRDCIAGLQDGRVMVKVLRPGTQRNRWTLASYNSPDLDNVEISWVAPIRWIRRS